MPQVSIIIPVYNTEQYLRQCLDSAINQILQDIEIICVNDGSTDGSLAILEEYAKKDNRIVLINKKNGGPGEARNAGMSCAKSAYIMFLDSDDYYVFDMCRKMVETIEKDDSDIAVCNIAVIYETDEHMKNSDKKLYVSDRDGKHNICGELIYKFCGKPVWNAIFRNEIILTYKISFPEKIFYEDPFFLFNYLTVSKSISFVSERLVFYRRRLGGIMNTTFNEPGIMPLDYLRSFPLFYNHLQNHKMWDRYCGLFWKLFIDYFRLAYFRLKKSNKEKAVILSKEIICIIKKPQFEKLPANERNLLLALKNKNYKACRKEFSLFGLRVFCLEKDPFFKYELRILGLSIYKIKYFADSRCGLYIFGIYIKNFQMQNKG